jgi:hypothetical protein
MGAHPRRQPMVDRANVRVVGAYKDLARVERAFRSLKTVDLCMR